jgi:hypothetical protein
VTSGDCLRDRAALRLADRRERTPPLLTIAREKRLSTSLFAAIVDGSAPYPTLAMSFRSGLWKMRNLILAATSPVSETQPRGVLVAGPNLEGEFVRGIGRAQPDLECGQCGGITAKWISLADLATRLKSTAMKLRGLRRDQRLRTLGVRNKHLGNVRHEDARQQFFAPYIPVPETPLPLTYFTNVLDLLAAPSYTFIDARRSAGPRLAFSLASNPRKVGIDGAHSTGVGRRSRL